MSRATPRARRIGVGIAICAIAATGVLVVLGSTGGTTAPDPFMVAANRICLNAGGEIAKARRQYRSASDPRPLAQALVHTTGLAYGRLVDSPLPADQPEQAVELQNSMLESEQSLLHLVKLEILAKAQVRADAKQTEAVSARIAGLASSLGLSRCAHLELGISPGPS